MCVKKKIRSKITLWKICKSLQMKPENFDISYYIYFRKNNHVTLFFDTLVSIVDSLNYRELLYVYFCVATCHWILSHCLLLGEKWVQTFCKLCEKQNNSAEGERNRCSGHKYRTGRQRDLGEKIRRKRRLTDKYRLKTIVWFWQNQGRKYSYKSGWWRTWRVSVFW